MYLNNKELHKELIYCQAIGKFSNSLYKMSKLIIDNLTLKYSYMDESVREDCKGFAMEKCYTNYHKFDADRGEAFTFMTQVVKTAFMFEFNRQRGYKTGAKEGNKMLDVTPFSRLFTDGNNPL
jgi:hypothetical protein